MSDSAMRQPVAGLVLNPGFHPKKIPGPKRDLPSSIHSNQGLTVIKALQHERHDYRVKQDSKCWTLIKPGLFIEENSHQQESAANHQTKLKFPESFKNPRRNQHHKNRSKCASRRNRKIKSRQELARGLALH